ncbi:MAG: AAA family ATPase [Bacillota bacterium]
MNILCTGITCSDRKELCDEIAAASGGQITYLDVGNYMREIADQLQLGIPDDKILDAPETTLKVLRKLAFEHVISDLRNRAESGQASQHAIVGLHATFRWRQRTMLGFDPDCVGELAPDIFVTVVDDVRDVKARLDRLPKWLGQKLQYDDILDWIDQETVVTEMLASIQRKPFYPENRRRLPFSYFRWCRAMPGMGDYLVARKEDIRTFRDLIMKPDLTKVYLSYGITGASKDAIAAAQDLADQMRDHLIVFNPLSIKDMELARANRPQPSNPGVEQPDGPVSLPDRVTDRIEKATVYRDYRLIAQSDMIVVYYPQDKYSHGVASEINFAHANGKFIVMIWPHSPQSPFLKNQADKTYESVEEFLEHVRSGSLIERVVQTARKVEVADHWGSEEAEPDSSHAHLS